MSHPPSLQGSTPQDNVHEADKAPADENGADQTSGKKRKRKTLACYDCRRRKLKCDRIFPACGRCVRAGQADKCYYESLPADNGQDASSGSDGECQKGFNRSKDRPRVWVPRATLHTGMKPPQSDSPPSNFSMLRGGKMEQLEDRIARLEALSKNALPAEFARPVIASHASSPLATGSIAPSKPDSSRDVQQTDVEMMYFKGRSFHTQYYGASNPTSMISQFPELRAFMKAAIRQYSSLARVQSDLKLLNENLKIPEQVYTTTLEVAMLNLVPRRDIADHLVQIYFDSLEGLYRVLHIQSFYTEYDHFWEAPQDARAPFVAILLLVMATVTGLASNGPKLFIGRSSQTRETSVRWVKTVEDWMATQSRKHVQIENFQIWLLTVIAKHMNIIKKKRAWEEAGNVIKIFMSGGMHRDPAILGKKISFFDQEMRRRLWMTAVEWDLQACVSRGMPSSVAAYPYDCAAPMNLDDKSFTETTVHPPKAKPSGELSDTSFHHLSSRSLRLRIQLASLVNDPTAHVDYEDVLKYEEYIKEELDAIPSWEDSATPNSGKMASNPLAPVLLDIQLRQFLLWLHFPYASKNGNNSRSNYSRTACFNNATYMLNLHASVMEKENYTLCLLRNDGYLAALSMCHNLFAASYHKNNPILHTLSSSFEPAIKKALSVQEEKIMRLGEGRNHYWFVSAASCFVQAKLAPETSAAAKQRAVEQVTRLFYKMLASQEDFNAESQVPPALDTGAAQRIDQLVPQNPKDLEQPQTQVMNGGSTTSSTEFDPFQHLDPSEWALENLWPLTDLDFSNMV